MFWTIMGVVFGAICAIAAIISIPRKNLRRKRNINELFMGKQLVSKRNALEISGELESGLSNQYWLHIYNAGNRENGVRTILFYKGKPHRNGYLFEAYPVSEDGHYLQLKTGESKDIFLDSSEIVKSYEKNNGKCFGKPTDEVHVLLKDLWENHYVINTQIRIEGFRALAKCNKTEGTSD